MSVLKEMTKNGKNCRRDRIDFLAISPTIFELQRPTTLKNTQKWPKKCQKDQFSYIAKLPKTSKNEPEMSVF